MGWDVGPEEDDPSAHGPNPNASSRGGSGSQNDPRDYHNWSISDGGGKLAPNPNAADYPADRILEGTQYTKQMYMGKDGGSYPVIQTADGSVLAYPSNSAPTDMQTVVITGQRFSLDQHLDLDVADQIARNNAQLDQNLQALAQNLQANPVEFQIAPTQTQAATQSYLNAVGANPYVSETFGVQSLPGTIDGTKDLVTGAVAAYSARNLRITYVSPQANGAGAVITTNRNPANGAPRVTVNYGVTQPSTLARLGVATAGVMKKAPVLSLVGTTLEYGAYHYAGLNKNSYGDSRYTFAADATLDAGKSVAAGAFGVGAGVLSSVLVGAAGGSIVPGLGTVVGAVVGLGAGTWAAAQFENQVYTRANARQNFSEYLQRQFK
ncbi:MAG TPA: hypothetical protein VFG03_06450 [Telluria sp.]|nr:hypothetical protein [Telluria sp.]